MVCFVYRLEPLVVADVLYEWLHLPQPSLHRFQLSGGTIIGAVNILDFGLKINIPEKAVLGEIADGTSSFLKVVDEDYAEGLLDEEEYTFAKKSYDEQYADLSRRLDEAVQRRAKFSEAMSVDNKWITLMKSVSSATQLSQDLVDESIELVKVHEHGAVELVMKYGDLYAVTVRSIREVQEAM